MKLFLNIQATTSPLSQTRVKTMVEFSRSALKHNSRGAVPDSPQHHNQQRRGRNRSPSTQSSTFLVRDPHKRRESLRRIGVITKREVVPVYARVTTFRDRRLFRRKIRPTVMCHIPNDCASQQSFCCEVNQSISGSHRLQHHNGQDATNQPAVEPSVISGSGPGTGLEPTGSVIFGGAGRGSSFSASMTSSSNCSPRNFAAIAAC